MLKRRFVPCIFDEVEDVEDYKPGGFHPVRIGDKFNDGRYRILHKLGNGGSSTIWLARDEQFSESGLGKLVTIKALRADAFKINSPELVVPTLMSSSESFDFYRKVEDNFVVNGPNGTHMFIIYAFAGPSVRAISEFPENRRLRADLARKIAAQASSALQRIHRAGFIHGDFTTSNFLFRLTDDVCKWSDEEVYFQLESPETDIVQMLNGQPIGPQVPSEVTEAIDPFIFFENDLLQESVVVIDFGQAYAASEPLEDYKPRTLMNYMSPETRFEGRVGPESDVWTLGCAIFEIRTGFPLFNPFFPSDAVILTKIVGTLGRLPDPWWNVFKNRHLFEEDGQPKTTKGLAVTPSIRELLQAIGTREEILDSDGGLMFEQTETKIDENEVDLLVDLLEKMLKYRPEDRIGIEEVVSHPWFKV
ncbi:MAG: kinase-like domain-containing protein [Lentinula lateritia]|nr:MAG: kinase-like domain-containing protein [Lentinula lateritia]